MLPEAEKVKGTYKLNDKEVLYFAYGALKACEHLNDGMKKIVKVVEAHLYPQPVFIDEAPLDQPATLI